MMMKTITSKRLFSWMIGLGLAWTPLAMAEVDRIGLTVQFPGPVAVGATAVVKLTANPTVKEIAIDVTPFREVVKNSDAAKVKVPSKVEFVDGKGEIAIAVSGEGEFNISLKANGDSRGLGIIAEGGLVWIGLGNVDTLLQSRLLTQIKAEMPGAEEVEIQKEFHARYQELMKARLAKGAQGSTGFTTKAVTAADIKAGDVLFFKAQWQGPKPSDPKKPDEPDALTVFENFPVDGVKVEFRNSTNSALVTTTYLVNGSCSFTAPTDGFVPIVRLIAAFPGITAAGAVNTGGGGIGNFETKDLGGTLYSYDIPTPLTFLGKTDATTTTFVFDRSAGRGGDNLARMMATFHCVVEMVRELKKSIGVDKKSAFIVTFPESGTVSNYTSGNNSLNITTIRAYVWDVIGHEFGHMVQNDTTAINAAGAGGAHDGSNQYDYATNASTAGKKDLSNRLALNEGYGTWIGVGFTERSSRYAGKFKWVGDLLYRDWVDLENNVPKFSFSPSAYKGEDTEVGLQALLWDLHDANSDAYPATGLKDETALGMKALFDKFKGKNMDSVFDVWRQVFVPGADMANFTKASGIDSPALRKAFGAANTFAEFGCAPHLILPKKGEKIDLTAAKGPKVQWKQYFTGNAAMDLNKFQLILYSNDLTTRLWQSAALSKGAAPLVSPVARTYEYELTKADLDAIKAATKDRKDASVVLAILGTADLAPATGHYLSNPVELLLQDFNRAMVAVVDSSGSNTSTDPTNQRVVASKESVRRLVSLADAKADPKKVPDIAAAVDFDSSVTILSGFADPDTVLPTLDRIDSSGGTSIDGGINAGVGLLDAINTGPGLLGAFRDRSALLLFTDGENNSGQGPVIAAIVAATLKGYRVHYGFLSPLVSPFSVAEGVDAPFTRAITPKDTTPTTIEQAVLQSGGVFARIGDAQSQVAFIEQVFARGLTNIDGDNTSGGLLIGQANTADQLTAEFDMKSYTFSGQANENVTVRVETINFRPNVTVFDRDGNILATDTDENLDGRTRIDLPPLPYTGEYTVRVYSEDGRLGLFNIFIDVQNVIGNLPVIESQGDLVLNRQTGLFEQRVTIRNNTAGAVNGFQIEASSLPDGGRVMSAEAGSDTFTVNTPIAAGGVLEIVIEYFSPTRTAFSPVLNLIAGPPVTPPTLTGGFSASGFRAANGSFVVEFESVPGQLYYIQYSDDGMATWQTVLPPIDARGTRVQWIDSGPPKTASHPSTVPSRFYKIARP